MLATRGLEYSFLEHLRLDLYRAILILRSALSTPHFLSLGDIIELFILFVVMDVTSDDWGSFGHADDGLLTPKTYLILEEVLQFFKRDGLIGSCVYSPNDGIELSIGKEQILEFEEVVKVNSVQSALVVSIDATVDAENRVIRPSLHIVGEKAGLLGFRRLPLHR